MHKFKAAATTVMTSQALMKTHSTGTICGASLIELEISPDGTQIAFSPNNHLIYILDVSADGAADEDCSKWKILHTLDCHTQCVMGICWGKKTNRIVSCAQDRTAYVWDYNVKENKWEPCHVMLDAKVKRGLTCAKWSASEQRIFVGSAANNVAMGKYDADQVFWKCLVATPHVSVITCLAPHPTEDKVFVTGSTDCTVAITQVKGSNTSTVGSFQLNAWINDVQWNAAANALAIATQDSRVHILAAPGEAEDYGSYAVAVTIRLRQLPLRRLAFVDGGAKEFPTLLIGAGYDCYPVAFAPKFLSETEEDPTSWQLVGSFTDAAKQAAAPKKELTLAEQARLKFQSEAAFGQSAEASAADSMKTRHKGTIVSVRHIPDGCPLAKKRKVPAIFITGSLDGRMEPWTMDDFEKETPKK